MSRQKTATFQTCGIKPSFSDMVKALENDVVDIIPRALPFFSSVLTMRIRVSGSTSAAKSLSSSVCYIVVE